MYQYNIMNSYGNRQNIQVLINVSPLILYKSKQNCIQILYLQKYKASIALSMASWMVI